MKNPIQPTNQEKVMRENYFIVSKTDTKGRITYGNEIFIEFSGYSEKELQEIPARTLIHPDDTALIESFQEVLMANPESPATYITRIVAKGGETLWVEVKATRIEWQNRPAALCFFTDVSNLV